MGRFEQIRVQINTCTLLSLPRNVMIVRVSTRLPKPPPRDERSDSRKAKNSLYYGHYANAMSVKMLNITNNTNAIVVFVSFDELVIEESTTRSDVGVVSDGLRDGT